jgi:hypothetical protein
MHKRKVSRVEAERLLREAKGSLRRALGENEVSASPR